MDQDWDTWNKLYGRHYWRIDLGTATDFTQVDNCYNTSKINSYVSTTVTSPKPTVTQIDSCYNTPKPAATQIDSCLTFKTGSYVSTAATPSKLTATQIDSLESNTPEALESTVNAFTAITTTAVPHTLAPLTTPLIAEHLEKSSSFTQSIYKANSLHEIDSLHEINSFEYGYWEVTGGIIEVLSPLLCDQCNCL
ncbi:hypothetical protein NA56DRAFT_712871 [Hyaloscypha hepaticicola]|uniref:Uncharacterized protein n=1 Tax=Hyaloscypha hepaticicola TaxID=2082293 RepID=A0A2J6PFA2_9HELO|nr:hypothetical protein NA56DRAFT_712871 [Hyaloscypha hepaticicola]